MRESVPMHHDIDCSMSLFSQRSNKDARSGNKHNKTLGQILGKHANDRQGSQQDEDWWEHEAARNRERRSVLERLARLLLRISHHD